MVNLSGGEALAKSLSREGVEVVFGIPGIQTYGIVAGLRDEPGIRMIAPRHEQAATYMADGYARTSGDPGVALVVPGVGLFNAAPGLATAYARSSPVLLIAGQIPRAAIGKGVGAVHEVVDQADTVRTVTKWRGSAMRPRDVPSTVNEAFRQLRSGRPRPVLIEVPPEAGVEREDVELCDPTPITPARARLYAVAVSRPDHRRITATRYLRRWWGRPLQCRGCASQIGRGDKYPGHHLERRQGMHAGQPPALLWLLL